MEIRVLKYFMAVCNEGSFYKAAESLHITQPTLSRQIAQLEEETGKKLFERTTRKVTLTNEGLLLKRRAQDILTLVEKTEQELSAKEEIVEGDITIGGGQIESIFDLADIIRDFHKLYPNVHFHFVNLSSDRVIEQMESGLIDVGLVLEPIQVDQFGFKRLKRAEKMICLMRADDPLASKDAVSPKDLLDRPVILPGRFGARNQLKNWFGEDFDQVECILTNNLSANNDIFVHRGLGRSICMMPMFTSAENAELTIKPLDPPVMTRCMIIWRRDLTPTAALAKFIEYINAYEA